MMIQWTIMGSMNVAGAVTVVLFGLLVASIPPRGRVQFGFGLFAAAWGLATLVVNLAMMSEQGHPWLGMIPWLTVLLTAVAASGLFVLWGHMPRPLEPRNRVLLVPALATAAPFLGWAAFGMIRMEPFDVVVGPAAPVLVGISVIWGLWAGLLVLLVLRYIRDLEDPVVVRQAPILSSALAIYLAVNARWVLPMHPEVMRVQGLLTSLFLALLAGLWLYAAFLSDRKAPRNVTLIILAVALVGFMHDAFLTAVPTMLGIDGAARIATVVVLAVAILRFEALGVHTKLRFGISKTVLAGVFLAVFTIASETTKLLFSGFAGNEFIGIAAAGMLVFLIAPLQRLADRFAVKAVPVEGPSVKGSQDGEASYRKALRWALKDGTLSGKEEKDLLILAEDLGISTRRAYALREEVEASSPPKRRRRRAG